MENEMCFSKSTDVRERGVNNKPCPLQNHTENFQLSQIWDMNGSETRRHPCAERKTIISQ